MSEAKKELLGELIDLLRNDVGAWHMGGSDYDCLCIHRSGLKLWVYCGSANVWDPERIYFSYWGKKRLRAAFRYWRRVHGRRLDRLREAAAIQKSLEMLRRP